MLKSDSGAGGGKSRKKPSKKTPPKTAKTIAKQSAGRGGAGKRGGAAGAARAATAAKGKAVGTKKIAAQKKKTAKANAQKAIDAMFTVAKKAPAPTPKASSDWDKGAGWMDKQFNSQTGKKVSKKGGTKGKWWNPFD